MESVETEEARQDGKPPRRLRRARRAAEDATPVERLVLRTPATFRRRLVVGAAAAIVALAAIAGYLAWRQYQANQHRALNDLDGRVALVGSLIDNDVAGGISTLETAAATPAVMEGRIAAMRSYLRRVNAAGGKLFTAGMGWVDTTGQVRASSRSRPSINVADRDYFKQIMATGKPYVSSGLVGRGVGRPVVVLGVPTFDARGRLTGALTGGVFLNLQTTPGGKRTEQLGFTGLTVVDRAGQVLSSGLRPVADPSVFARMKSASTGDLVGVKGLQRGSDHVIVFATAKTLGWKVAIDRPESALYASARRSLVIDLVSIGAAAVLALLILAFLARRSRQELEKRGEHAQAWSRLTRTLAVAATPAEVAEAVLDATQESFADAVVVVAVDSETGREVRAASSLPGWRRVPGDGERLRAVAELARSGPGTISIEKSAYRELYRGFGGRLRTLHAAPILEPSGEPFGGIALLTARPELDVNESELLAAYATQAARALDRARAFEHEHELAVRLQRSLLPADLPRAPGISLAGEYVAGGKGIEVGGDWYDAVLRPDGLLELCVGDVSGRGIGAATVMGRQRSIFRAYAFDSESPGEILRRMIRHVADDEMITAACISVDPLEGILTYACAGHPPPLLLDDATGEVVRLDGASSPPLGVAEPGDVIETTIALPDRATLALYTDGLVERRGDSIERGIDALAEALGSGAASAELALGRVSEAIGAPGDDVALLVARFEPAPSFAVEVPAQPDALPGLRRRLRGWLLRHGFERSEPEVVLSVSEALNNAIEHAYGGAGGTIRVELHVDGDVLRVEVADRGRWLPERPSDERGRGIMLMRSLMDRVEIESNGEGTSVRLERRKGAEAAAAPAAASG